MILAAGNFTASPGLAVRCARLPHANTQTLASHARPLRKPAGMAQRLLSSSPVPLTPSALGLCLRTSPELRTRSHHPMFEPVTLIEQVTALEERVKGSTRGCSF